MPCLCVTVTLGESAAKSPCRRGVGEGFLEAVTWELCWEEEWDFAEWRKRKEASRQQEFCQASPEVVGVWRK